MSHRLKMDLNRGSGTCSKGREGSSSYRLLPFISKFLSLNYALLILADINELNLPSTCCVDFPDPNDLLSFKITICPDEVSLSRGVDLEFYRPVGLIYSEMGF